MESPEDPMGSIVDQLGQLEQLEFEIIYHMQKKELLNYIQCYNISFISFWVLSVIGPGPYWMTDLRIFAVGSKSPTRKSAYFR